MQSADCAVPSCLGPLANVSGKAPFSHAIVVVFTSLKPYFLPLGKSVSCRKFPRFWLFIGLFRGEKPH